MKVYKIISILFLLSNSVILGNNFRCLFVEACDMFAKKQFINTSQKITEALDAAISQRKYILQTTIPDSYKFIIKKEISQDIASWSLLDKAHIQYNCRKNDDAMKFASVIVENDSMQEIKKVIAIKLIKKITCESFDLNYIYDGIDLQPTRHVIVSSKVVIVIPSCGYDNESETLGFFNSIKKDLDIPHNAIITGSGIGILTFSLPQKKSAILEKISLKDYINTKIHTASSDEEWAKCIIKFANQKDENEKNKYFTLHQAYASIAHIEETKGLTDVHKLLRIIIMAEKILSIPKIDSEYNYNSEINALIDTCNSYKNNLSHFGRSFAKRAFLINLNNKSDATLAKIRKKAAKDPQKIYISDIESIPFVFSINDQWKKLFKKILDGIAECDKNDIKLSSVTASMETPSGLIIFPKENDSMFLRMACFYLLQVVKASTTFKILKDKLQKVGQIHTPLSDNQIFTLIAPILDISDID